MVKELTDKQKEFIVEYLKTRNGTQAYMKAYPDASYRTADVGSRALLDDPRIRSEIARISQPVEISSLASAREVLEFFASVMRGEVKDQFGLEAPLSERLKAANELAKRTVDIENRRNGEADAVIEVKLDWDR